MAGNKINQIKFSPVDIEARKKLDFKAGDTIIVSSKILDEKGKYRLQAFEGIVRGRADGDHPRDRMSEHAFDAAHHRGREGAVADENDADHGRVESR